MSDYGSNSKLTVKERHQAGHYEVVGETLARIEFFEQGWNPYSRFLDVEMRYVSLSPEASLPQGSPSGTARDGQRSAAE